MRLSASLCVRCVIRISAMIDVINDVVFAEIGHRQGHRHLQLARTSSGSRAKCVCLVLSLIPFFVRYLHIHL